MDPTAAFAAVLRRAREQQGFTQRELAGLARVHPNFIGRMERGQQEPTLSTIFALAVALDIEPDELMRDVKLAMRQPE